MRILLVEDDVIIAERVKRALVSSSYVVEQVSDGEDAWFRGDTENFDAAILDLGLPLMDGIQVLKRWREAGRNMPVLILTARGSWIERVEGIDAGADDYLPKPFQMAELKARLRALLRRATGNANPVITLGSVCLDTRQMQVYLDDALVAVTPLEFRLLSYLMHHQGRVISKLELSEHVYGEDIENDRNAIEVLVARLRKKLHADLIETRRGHGYIVKSPDSPIGTI